MWCAEERKAGSTRPEGACTAIRVMMRRRNETAGSGNDGSRRPDRAEGGLAVVRCTRSVDVGGIAAGRAMPQLQAGS